MYFGIPQIIFTVLLLISLGMHLAKNGEPRDGCYSFWTAFVSCAIQFFLLWWGGFYG